MTYTIVKMPHKYWPFVTDQPYHVEMNGVRFHIHGTWEWDTEKEANKALQGYIKSLTREVVATYEV